MMISEAAKGQRRIDGEGIMNLTFLGAAGTVTGSKTLIECNGHRILVDCGLFQGYKNLRALNWIAFPFVPSELAAVVLTHAHVDHCGALPLLHRQGFRGPIYATSSTIELCKLLLIDSAELQQEEANYANKHHTSRHEQALPLYSVADARATLRQFRELAFDKAIEVAPGMTARLRPAGHILGAGSAEITAAGKTVLFSGDIGRPHDRIMRPPTPIERADYLVVESTYGDRLHELVDAEDEFGRIICRTIGRGGIVVVPAFAVGRAQELLLALYRLKQRGVIPDIPVYLNSPMAIDMTKIYHSHRLEHRLSAEDCSGMFRVAKMVRTVEESRELDNLRYPSVIVSASGMATGGRVLHHLKTLGPDRRNCIVFAGFQAAGTRGARLLAGERTTRIFGEEIPVNAEVVALPALSAHADAAEIIDWLRTAPTAPIATYLNHGEPGPADALRQRIEHELKWSVMVPLLGQRVELT